MDIERIFLLFLLFALIVSFAGLRAGGNHLYGDPTTDAPETEEKASKNE